MIDRLIHHSEILSLKGDSYRLRGTDLDARNPGKEAVKATIARVAGAVARPGKALVAPNGADIVNPPLQRSHVVGVISWVRSAAVASRRVLRGRLSGRAAVTSLDGLERLDDRQQPHTTGGPCAVPTQLASRRCCH
jgi:IstB-like ATP binding protein